MSYFLGKRFLVNPMLISNNGSDAVSSALLTSVSVTSVVRYNEVNSHYNVRGVDMDFNCASTWLISSLFESFVQSC